MSITQYRPAVPFPDSNTVTILALAVFSLPDRASRLELFTYCERFRASGSEPEALSVSLPTEQRRPLDLL